VKIILLSTGRGLHEQAIDDLRDKLDLSSSDVVCLVSWHPPRRPLPVDRHLVLGPQLQLSGDPARVNRVQRRPELIAAAAERVRAISETALTIQPADPVQAPATAQTAPADISRPKVTTAHLPIIHPRRLRRAVAWRIRRLKRTARTQVRQARKHAQAPSALGVVRKHPALRHVRRRLTLSVSLSYAATCLRSEKVHAMARDSDLVVALDAASQRGAWTLAQRVQGPAIVVGVPAAKQVLERR